MQLSSCKYVVITPVRDEQQYLPFTIESVLNQTVPPSEWVIVNDGSTDGTGQIIDEAAARHPWIRPVHRHNRGFRKSGAGVVEAFYNGYNSVESADWQFVVKLDGDLSFPPDFFETAFLKFDEDRTLGIGGAFLYHDVNGELKLEQCPKFHVRGATKIYRRACWEAIGGLRSVPGWDTIDEVGANMHGWRTESFPDLRAVHHRMTGTAESRWRDMIKIGKACYCTGYHPAFFAAKCLYRLASKPYGLGAIGLAYGFLSGYFGGAPRPEDRALVHYVRRQQLRRMCGLQSIWK